VRIEQSGQSGDAAKLGRDRTGESVLVEIERVEKLKLSKLGRDGAYEIRDLQVDDRHLAQLPEVG